MRWSILRAILILPVSVIVVPAILLPTVQAAGIAVGRPGIAAPAFWLALPLGLAGCALAGWTMRSLFAAGAARAPLIDGRGHLAVRGPYRHVRNPLVCAGVLLLASEALMLDSWLLAVWLAVFYLASAAYVTGIEERALEQRLGAAWWRYKAHVPRWFPSPLAYDPGGEPRQPTGSNR